MCSSYTADGVLLFRVLDVAAAEVGVIVGNGGDDVMQGQVEAPQVFGIDLYGVLLCFAAPRVDLG